MKGKLSRMGRSGISFLLAFCMLASMFTGVAFASEPQKTINYVSLGDSMTNGYGLTGYEPAGTTGGANGYLQVAPESYPAKFAAYLAGYNGEIAAGQSVFTGNNATVNLTQLAMSGMRPEDALFALAYDWENWEPGTMSRDEFDSLGLGDYHTWDEFVNSKFRQNYGDWYNYTLSYYCTVCEESFTGTYKGGKSLPASEWDVCEHVCPWGGKTACDHSGHVDDADVVKWYKTGGKYTVVDDINTYAPEYDGYNYVIPYYAYFQTGNDGLLQANDQGSLWLGNGNAATAAEYQAAIKNADVISICLGNANFGVVMLARLLSANGLMKGFGANDYCVDSNGDWVFDISNYDYQDLKKTISDPAILQVAEEAEKLVLDYFGIDGYEETKDYATANLILYTTASYMLSYRAMLDRIAELNPDAEIMIVGNMNAMSGTYMYMGDGEIVDLQESMEGIFGLLNDYLAGLATLLNKADPAHKDITYYYAEVPTVDVLVNHFADEIDGDNVLRDRFIEEVTGRIFYMMKDMLAGMGYDTNEALSRADVENYIKFRAAWEKYTRGEGAVPTIGAFDLESTPLYYDAEGKLTSEDKAVTTFNNPYNKLMLCAIYMAFETAIIEGSRDGILYESAIDSTANGFEAVFGAIRAAVGSQLGDPATEGAKLAAAYVDSWAMTLDETTIKPVYDGICAANAGAGAQMAKIIAYVILEEELINLAKLPDIEITGDPTSAVTAFITDSANGYAATKLDSILFTAMTETGEDVVFPTLLSMFGRMIVGTGVGQHPSAGGHVTLTDAVIDAYGNGYTANDKTNENISAYLNEFYNFLANDTSYSTTEKVELLEKLYEVVKGNVDLSEYPEVAAVEAVYRELTEKNLIGDKQVLDIVLYIYADLLDDGNVNLRDIARYVYFDVLAIPEPQPMKFMMRARVADVTMTPAVKLEIIETIYGVLKTEAGLLDTVPELQPIEDLYFGLTEEDLLTDEQILSIFDTVFEAVVDNETITDEVIADVTDKIVEDILLNPDIPTENKLAIVEKVADAMGDVDLGGSVPAIPEIPYMDVIKDIQKNLKDAGLLTDAQANDILTYLYNLLTSGEELNEYVLLDVAKYVYDVMFNAPGITATDKVEIIRIIYVTLEDHGVVSQEIIIDGLKEALKLAKQYAYEYYDEAYAYGYNYILENGYIDALIAAIDAAIAAIKSVDLSNTQITAESQANIYTELNATVATLEELKAALANGDVQDVDGLVNTVLALTDDLNIHLENLKTFAKQAGANIYELVYLPLKDIVINEVIPEAYLAVNNALNEITGYMLKKICEAYDIVLDVNATFVDVINAVRDHVEHVLGGDVEISEDTFYLAIVNGEEAYADLLATALGLTDEQYKKVSADEVTAEDIAKATIITVGYNTDSVITFTADQLLGVANGYVQYTDEFIKAVDAKMEASFPSVMEMIDIDIYETVMEIVNAEAAEYLAMLEGKEAVELDWAALVGEKNTAYIEAAKAELRAALIEAGIPENYTFTLDIAGIAAELIAEKTDGLASLNIEKLQAALGEHAVFTLEIPVVDLAVFAAESAMYEFIAYNKEYSELVLSINAINPDATVALLGNYNRYDVDYTVVTDAVTFTLADVLAEFGFEGFALPEEAKAALAEFAAIGVYEINIDISKYVDAALEQYKNLAGFVANFEIPVCEEAELLIADLLEISNAYVEIAAGKVQDVYTIEIPVTELVNLVVEKGYEIDELINKSLNTEITIDGKTIEANDVLDLLANLSSIHPFIYSVVFPNMFYVDISDALAGGDAYIADAIYAALNISYEEEEETGLWGDANGDGIVNTTDARLVLQYYTSAGAVEINTAVCDVDGINGINTTDARLILQHYTSGGTMRFPVEE